MVSISSNFKKHTNNNYLQRWLIKRFHKGIENLLIQTDFKNCFEAGCGEGFSSQVIVGNKNHNFIGMDININSLKLAKQRCQNAYFIKGDIFRIPFFDARFDMVISTEVLEHLDNPMNALTELCRVSKKWLILSVPNEPFFCIANFLRGKNIRHWGNDPDHINHWTMRSFELFVKQRCTIVKRNYSFPWILLLCRKK